MIFAIWWQSEFVDDVNGNVAEPSWSLIATILLNCKVPRLLGLIFITILQLAPFGNVPFLVALTAHVVALVNEYGVRKLLPNPTVVKLIGKFK